MRASERRSKFKYIGFSKVEVPDVCERGSVLVMSIDYYPCGSYEVVNSGFQLWYDGEIIADLSEVLLKVITHQIRIENKDGSYCDIDAPLRIEFNLNSFRYSDKLNIPYFLKDLVYIKCDDLGISIPGHIDDFYRYDMSNEYNAKIKVFSSGIVDGGFFNIKKLKHKIYGT